MAIDFPSHPSFHRPYISSRATNSIDLFIFLNAFESLIEVWKVTASNGLAATHSSTLSENALVSLWSPTWYNYYSFFSWNWHGDVILVVQCRLPSGNCLHRNFHSGDKRPKPWGRYGGYVEQPVAPLSLVRRRQKLNRLNAMYCKEKMILWLRKLSELILDCR
jgi:hypothetical protein